MDLQAPGRACVRSLQRPMELANNGLLACCDQSKIEMYSVQLPN